MTSPLAPDGHYAVGACQPASADLCQNELLPFCRVAAWLDAGTPLLALPAPFAESALALAAQKPVFLRHLFPASLWLPPETIQSASAFAEALLPLLPQEPVALQIRRVQRAVCDVPALAEVLAARGVSLARDNAGILSGVVTESGGFFGVSRAAQNLSPHAGGMRHFPPDDACISRAEHKLAEALEVFSLTLPNRGAALDLGAAPGGWSRVLLSHGLSVTAVDPAALAPSLAGRVVHFTGLAQEFAARTHAARFAVIVNDMRLDASESAAVMVSLAPLLAENGLAIMTLKLPERGKTAAIRKAMAVMAQAYTRENARQLFHNRSEITAVFAKK